MAAADQSERWTLHNDPYGMRTLCYSSEAGQTRWCNSNGYRDHVEVVPASALDAARERAERAEAELEKAREEIASHERAYAEAVGFRAGHPVLCCGQCQDTLANLTERAERAEAELAKAKAEARAMKQELRDWIHGEYCGLHKENPDCARLTEELKANP